MSDEHHSLDAFFIGLTTIFLIFGVNELGKGNFPLAIILIGIFVGLFIYFTLKGIRTKNKKRMIKKKIQNKKKQSATATELKEMEKLEKEEAELEEKLELKNPKSFWLWIILANEVILFTMLIGSSFALRILVDQELGLTWLRTNYLGNHDHLTLDISGWVDGNGNGPTEVLDIVITTINTFILIISSFTMAMAVEFAKKGEVKIARYLLLATAGIGAIFLGVQIYEYSELLLHGFNLSSGLFGATFYIQTGVHGLHVLAGIILILIMAHKVHKGGDSKKDKSDIENLGLYWHFVDLVWVLLFTLVYLI